MKPKTAQPKPQTPRDSEHLKFIRGLACCVCKKPPPSDAAHVRIGGGGGMGLKPSDFRTVPLCNKCHATQHSVGEKQFWEVNGWHDGECVVTAQLIGRINNFGAVIDLLTDYIEKNPPGKTPEG